jgi:hypothetical protein
VSSNAPKRLSNAGPEAHDETKRTGLRRLLATTLAILAAAFFLTLYGFEYLLWSQEYKDSVAGSFNRFSELHSRGEQIYPLLSPTQYAQVHPQAAFLPLSAPANVWMLGTNELGYWPRFKTDELGFNNPPGAHEPNPDILLIGDSIVQGISVETSENVSGRLRESGLRVTNLGQSGNGPLLELSILREYGLRLHAKDVVWFFHAGTDFADLDFEQGIKAFSLEASSSADADPLARRRRTDELWAEFLQSRLEQMPRVNRANLMRFLRLARLRITVLMALSPAKQESAPQADIDLIQSIVRTAKSECESAGSRFTFVYLPPTGAEADWDSSKANREAVKNAVAMAGIRVVDFGIAIQRYWNPLSLYAFGRGGGHYSREGYKLLAEFVASSLR